MPARSRAGARNPRPARRPPLTRGRIVEAALALAATRGDFSMRALGQRLRVDPMAIYRHFRDKDALLDAIVDEALGSFSPPAPGTGSARDRLRAMFLAFRAALDAHPGVAPRVSTTRPTLGPHTVELTESCMGLLQELGLDAGEATRAFITLIRFVTGVAAAEERIRAEGASEAEWQEEMRSGYASLPPERYPNVAAMADEISRIGHQDAFEYGLDRLLDAFAVRAAGSS